MMTPLTSSNFTSEIGAAPYVVQFWAAWCGPCFSQEDTLRALEILNPKVKFGRLNAEENPDVAGMHNLLAFPTVILFKDGKPAARFVGLQELDVLHEAIGKL